MRPTRHHVSKHVAQQCMWGETGRDSENVKLWTRGNYEQEQEEEEKRATKEEDERKIGREIAIKRDKNLESIRSKRKCIHFVGVHTYWWVFVIYIWNQCNFVPFYETLTRKKRGEDRWQGPSSMYTLDISEYIERMPIDIISQSYIILYPSIKHWYFAPAIFFYLHISALYLSFIVHTYLYFLFISFTMLKHRNLHNNFSIFLSFFPLSSLPWMICHVYSNTNALW